MNLTASIDFEIEIPDYDGGLIDFAISPDGNRLVGGELDGRTLFLWDIPASSDLWRFADEHLRMSNPAFSSDSEAIVFASDKQEELFFLRAADGELQLRLQMPYTPYGSQNVGADFHACLFGHEKDTVIVNCCGGTASLSATDGTVRWYDNGGGLECCTESLHLLSDGRVAYPCPDDSFVVRNLMSGVELKRFRHIGENIQYTAIDRLGSMLVVSTGEPGTLSLYSFETGDLLKTAEVGNYAKPIDISCDGKFIAAACAPHNESSGEELVCFLETETLAILATFSFEDFEVSCLKFHPTDATRLFCGIDNGKVFAIKFE